MGFSKENVNSFLQDAFAAGNTLELLSAVDVANETYTKLSGNGYKTYEIKSGDFVALDGELTSQKNILLFLAERDVGTASGIATFKDGRLCYIGAIDPVAITVNTVPVIRTYSESDGWGIKVTLEVVETASVSTADAV